MQAVHDRFGFGVGESRFPGRGGHPDLIEQAGEVEDGALLENDTHGRGYVALGGAQLFPNRAEGSVHSVSIRVN